MRTIEAEEARAQFDALLAAAEHGESIVVTVQGIPVARIVPVEQRYKDAAAAIEAWKRYREEHNITLGGDITIRELIEDGRERRYEWLTRSRANEDDRSE